MTGVRMAYTHLLNDNIMKTKETPGKDNIVVYRKDGKTPDLRYKSSREYVLAQYLEINEKKKKDGKIPDLRYKSLRDHVMAKHSEINKIHPVQIKPAGKKPVWKISG